MAAKGDLVQYWQYKCENVADLCFSQDAQMTREDVGALWRLADADGNERWLADSSDTNSLSYTIPNDAW